MIPGPESGALLHELIERQVRNSPDAIAVTRRQAALTYGELDARADRWARRLAALGAGPDALVGVHLERSPELVCVLFGILKAGAGYVPLDPAYPRDRLEFMADDAAMPVVVTEPPGLSLRTRRPVAVLTRDGLDGAVARPRAACHDNIAYVLYTSGSTGRPKGVALTHANAVDLVARTADAFGRDLRRVLAATSICFDCHVIEIFGPLCTGGAVALAETAMDIGARSEDLGVRLLHTVPSVVDELLRDDRLPASVRTVIVGGERLMPGLVERIYANSPIKRLVNIYGPAECTTYATLAEISDTPVTPAIGPPAPGFDVHLLDPDGADVADGEVGEMHLAGPAVSRGYLGRPGLTAERYLPDPRGRVSGRRCYRTGDLAYRDESGELYFMGRADEQIKVRGVRVEPGEVEQALAEHPAVLEAAIVAGGPGDGAGTPASRRLTAFVVPAEPLTADQLRDHLAARLPRQLRPDAYVFAERLARSPNGKIDRRALAALAGTDTVSSAPAAPCAAAEGDTAGAVDDGALLALLAELWADALGVEHVGAYDNLYDLGAQSLLMLKVRTSLCARLGRDVPVRLLFESVTVAEAAEQMRRLADQAAPSPDLTEPSVAAPARGSAVPESVAAPGGGSGQPAPLSPNQQALLARARANPDDPGLVLPLAVRLKGRLRLAALRGAFREAVRRHESLRMRIVDDGPEPFQQAARHTDPALPVVDLRRLAEPDAERHARALITEMARRDFDLGAGRPVRVVLIRLADDDHVLALALHHIVADAWSVEALGHQLVALYASGLAGRPPWRSEPAVRYTDWVASRRRWLDTPDGRAQRDHWLKRLAGLEPLRPPGGQRRGGDAAARVRVFLIPGELTGRIAELGSRAGATRHMVLLAGFAALLARRCGQSDLAVGCPTAGRPLPELADVIGPCYDALVIRLDLSDDPSFATLLRRVRDAAVDAYANDGVPFALLAAALSDGPEHPLFQASIVLQQPPSLLDPGYSATRMSQEPIGDVELGAFMRFPPPATSLDLELALFDQGESLEGVLTCRADVVAEEEVGQVAEEFIALLESATSRPGARVSELCGAGADSGRRSRPA